MRATFFLLLGLAVAALSPAALADLRVVPTYESLSVYWKPGSSISGDDVAGYYRVAGSSEAFTRFEMRRKPGTNEYRGSALLLDPGQSYLVKVKADWRNQAKIKASTRSDDFPVAETIYVRTGRQSAPLFIDNVHGSPDGYILYEPEPDRHSNLDGRQVENNIEIRNSSYVIIRGFRLDKARRSAVRIYGSAPVTDIVIEDNEITGWGRLKSGGNGLAKRDHAIKTNDGKGANYRRFTVQRNRIRNPRGDANSWDESQNVRDTPCERSGCHPEGATGIFFQNNAGNHVVRYNEILGTSKRMLLDGIGGSHDGRSYGGIGPDSDIYGNIVTHVWDDGIEVEGGGKNVRVWGNLQDRVFTAFAAAPFLEGPLYIFRNVVKRTRRSLRQGYRSGTFIKTQETSPMNAGLFVVHNTVGVGSSGGVLNGVRSIRNCLDRLFSRNNIIISTRYAFAGKGCSEPYGNDLDNDLYTGDLKNVDYTGFDGIEAKPVLSSSTFEVAAGTPGHDDGEVRRNYQLHPTNQPDRGAQEAGKPPLNFGID